MNHEPGPYQEPPNESLPHLWRALITDFQVPGERAVPYSFASLQAQAARFQYIRGLHLNTWAPPSHLFHFLKIHTLSRQCRACSPAIQGLGTAWLHAHSMEYSSITWLETSSLWELWKWITMPLPFLVGHNYQRAHDTICLNVTLGSEPLNSHHNHRHADVSLCN